MPNVVIMNDFIECFCNCQEDVFFYYFAKIYCLSCMIICLLTGKETKTKNYLKLFMIKIQHV